METYFKLVLFYGWQHLMCYMFIYETYPSDRSKRSDGYKFPYLSKDIIIKA